MSNWIIKNYTYLNYGREKYNAWHILCKAAGFLRGKTRELLTCAHCYEAPSEEIITQLKLLDDWWAIEV